MRHGTAACGMQYAVKRSGSAVAYCSLSIRCGTRDEEGFHSGIAHFTEHTIFKGTRHRSASVISSTLDRLGGELNAYTTKEEIVIHATVLKEDLAKAMSLILELATEATFPKEEIDIERGVVLDEINSYKDSPADDIYDKFEEALFEGHPLGRSILGTAASVKKITSEELHEFTGKLFRPGRMAFSIVADIDEARLEKSARSAIAKYFPAEGATESPQERESLGTPAAVVFDISKDKRNHEANAIIGATAPTLYMEKDRLATILMCNILGGPASNSILNSELREKNGWVYGVECSYTQYSDSGMVAISLGCDKENLDKCFRTIDRAISKLQQQPLTTAKLKAARKQLLGQLAISSDNGETQCLSMGKSLLAYGRIFSDKENRAAIEALTPEDIQNAAKAVFADGRISRMVFL